MDHLKNRKAEKISTEHLADETMNVISEMLNIIVSRTHIENPDQNFIYTGDDLKYFGVGHQLKISKLADTLYSTMKDVLVFVMSDMAKDSETDFKFQMPKHTSFVGSIIKSVSIEVMASNTMYRNYLNELASSTGKYVFDTGNEVFQSIYRDTVLKLAEKGYLFDDDAELLSIQRQMKGLPQLDNPISQTNPLQSITINAEDIIHPVGQNSFTPIVTRSEDSENKSINDDDNDVEDMEMLKSTNRNRIILPYLRRLFETKKATIVTKKRVEALVNIVIPDEEIKRVYDEKYNELMQSSHEDYNMSDVVKGHCAYQALSYLKEHYPKEQVDIMEKYLMNEKAANTKPRRRYVKVPSGKKIRYSDMMNNDFMQMPQEQMHPDGMMSLM